MRPCGTGATAESSAREDRLLIVVRPRRPADGPRRTYTRPDDRRPSQPSCPPPPPPGRTAAAHDRPVAHDAGLPPRAGGTHARVAHAAGGPLPARVPRDPRQVGLSSNSARTRGSSAEVMIATVERLGVDAAIIFSDLLPILEPMGMDLEFAAGEGPVIHNPIRSAADVDRAPRTRRPRPARLRDGRGAGDPGRPRRLDSRDRLRRGSVHARQLLHRGGTSKAWLHTKSLMYAHESAWHDLMGRIARAVSRYLVAQFDAGAQIVQLFDSWVGCLGPRRLPPLRPAPQPHGARRGRGSRARDPLRHRQSRAAAAARARRAAR